MTNEFIDAYTDLLEQYFLHPGETWSEGAYRLGQTLVRAGYELEDVVELHDTARQQLGQKYPNADFTSERGHYLLLEVLTAYAMAFKAHGELLKLRSRVLTESEPQYRTLVEHAHDGILIVQKGEIKFINPKLAEMTGYAVATLQAMDIGALLRSQELNTHLVTTIPDLSTPPLFTMAYLQTQSGWVPVEASVGPVLFGQQTATLIMVRDLTERMDLQRRLQNRSQRLSALNRIARAVSATLDLDTLLETVYAEIQTIFRPDAFFIALYDQAAQTIDFQFMIDEGRRNPPLKHPLDQGLTSHVIRSQQALMITDIEQLQAHFPQIEVWGTKKISATWLGVPMRIGGNFIGVMNVQSYYAHAYDQEHLQLLGTIADQVVVAIENARLYTRAQKEIVQRKTAEEALRSYSQDLESLVEERTRALRLAQEQIVRQEKLTVVGRLAANISHELRNPLGVITNAVYFLKMVLTEQNPKVHEYLDLIEEQARKASKIASNMLEFTRTRPPQREAVHIETFLQHILTLIPPPDHTHCHFLISPDLPPVYVDSTHLEQILTNLLSNAYQSMHTGGDVTLEATARDEQVILSMKDTGEGMSPEVLAQIFEPLYTTKARGIGLGLAITKNLVEANNGRIEVKSQEGIGSTFILYLPQVQQSGTVAPLSPEVNTP